MLKKKESLCFQRALTEILHSTLITVRAVIEKYKTDRLSEIFVADDESDRN
tara:strand:- start:383 stop:535 length:153 start_codon:yes stop_codon:yes gene_type:complete